MSATPVPAQTNPYPSCWISALTVDRGGWATLVACVLMVYCYTLSNRKVLWNIILVNGISGFIGVVLQTSFNAVNIPNEQVSADTVVCNNLFPRTGAVQNGLGIMLGLNEFFWYFFETSTVLYSFLKAETVTSVTLPRVVTIILKAYMVLFCLAYVPLRIYIGFVRTRDHTTWNAALQDAHSYAFIAWGVTEAVIFAMLIQAAVYARKPNSLPSVKSVVSTIFTSSILRLLVISVSTILIAVVIRLPPSDTQRTAMDILWLIRGAFPMILLVDVLMTQTLLVEDLTKSPEDEGMGRELVRASFMRRDPEEGIRMRKNRSENDPKPVHKKGKRSAQLSFNPFKPSHSKFKKSLDFNSGNSFFRSLPPMPRRGSNAAPPNFTKTPATLPNQRIGPEFAAMNASAPALQIPGTVTIPKPGLRNLNASETALPSQISAAGVSTYSTLPNQKTVDVRMSTMPMRANTVLMRSKTVPQGSGTARVPPESPDTL